MFSISESLAGTVQFVFVNSGSQADNYQVNNNFAMNAQPLDQFVIFAVKVRKVRIFSRKTQKKQRSNEQ